MPQRNSAFSFFINSITTLALAASLSIAIYGCSTQAPVEPPPPPVQPAPPPPPVVVAPPKEGPAKVTTASYYGPGLQGHVTSNGEVYDQHAMTAASRTLPIGSKAKVTNLKTGKSVVVRINDHGPYVKGRGIDLSRDAAKDIGIDHHGVAKVKVTRLHATSTEGGDDGSPAKVAKTEEAPHATSTDSASVANPATADGGAVPGSAASPAVEPVKAVSPPE